MTSIFPSSPTLSFKTLTTHLSTFPPPLLLPPHPYDASLTDKISSLYLHPTLETLLHLKNHDLPSAHFLVRHMQSPPQYAAMYLHGILHRIEGDVDNARAWYADVCESDVFTRIWGVAAEEVVEGVGKKVPGQRRARKFLDDVEGLQKEGKGDMEGLERESRREIEGVMEWCVREFGMERWEDVSGEWVQPSKEISEKGQSMIVGGEGWRQF